jgi:hypothetical protein
MRNEKLEGMDWAWVTIVGALIYSYTKYGKPIGEPEFREVFGKRAQEAMRVGRYLVRQGNFQYDGKTFT